MASDHVSESAPAPRCLHSTLIALAGLGMLVSCTTAGSAAVPGSARRSPLLCWTAPEVPVGEQSVSLAWMRPSLVVEPSGDVWLAWEDGAPHLLRRVRSEWREAEVPPPAGEASERLRGAELTDGPSMLPILFGRVNEENGASSVAIATWERGGWTWLGAPLNASHQPFMHVQDADVVSLPDGRIFFVGSEEQDVEPKGVFVARWTGRSWDFLGGSLDVDSEAYYVSPVLAARPGEDPWVAWVPEVNGSRFVRLARWTGKGWERIGEEQLGRLSLHARSRPQLKLTSGGAAWLAWVAGEEHGELMLAHFDGHHWALASTPPSSRGEVAGEVRMLLTADGQPLLAWTQRSAKGNEHLEVAEWTGSAWEQRVAGFHQVEGFSEVNALAVRANGADLWVAFDESDQRSRRTRLVRFSPCAEGEVPAPLPKEIAEADTWPQSVDEAVDRLVRELDADSKAQISSLDEADLGRLHLGFGTGIRNNFGLWRGNDALLESCGGGKPVHPERCSSVIIQALWQRLRSGAR